MNLIQNLELIPDQPFGSLTEATEKRFVAFYKVGGNDLENVFYAHDVNEVLMRLYDIYIEPASWETASEFDYEEPWDIVIKQIDDFSNEEPLQNIAY